MKKLIGAIAGAAAMMITGSANALVFDQNVTPDVIFGTGNANGFFTVNKTYDDGNTTPVTVTADLYR